MLAQTDKPNNRPVGQRNNKIGDTNEAELGQLVAKIETRTNCQCLCDLVFELSELDHNIKKLKNAIAANPSQLREAAKALWPKQLEAMKAYKQALFARIRDLMDNDND